jgi:4-diphosphocytidyl-2-C-methyl-D-erythritol kinase
MTGAREATLRSPAKLNLDLRVLYKRADNYHELRTVFQTISLADTIRIRFARARRTRLAIGGNVDIPDNLILRAAQAVLDTAKISASVEFGLDKRIPMGAGLGGGSSNAAAVLLALPILAGAGIPLAKLMELGAALGSDVPFFLYGGTALGIGRGTELYPLPDARARLGLLVAPGVHVSTAEAYRDLNREGLTIALHRADTEAFRSLVWALADPGAAVDWRMLCTNDFETAVFGRHPVLQPIKRKLARLGARPALMTGSGSAVFGLFDARERLDAAFHAFSKRLPEGSKIVRMALLTKRRYRDLWRRQLAEHITTEAQWPPRSLYLKP